MDTVVKKIDLFGNEHIEIVKSRKKKNKTLFDDYDGFLGKFKVKKTTDDCYTPPEVYNCIIKYVNEKCNIGNREIIRPFYPGNDYKDVDYPTNCVVIDNPPFSIISEITRFYIERDVSFFLFAPHLTLFSSDQNLTAIVCGADIVYENGAIVKTSFLTNMLGNIRIVGDVELYKSLTTIVKPPKANLPKYQYPENVLTVSMVHALVLRGVSLQINNDECALVRRLDSQKKHKRAIFGSGFLLSEAKAEAKAEVIIWVLSEREKNIIKALK